MVTRRLFGDVDPANNNAQWYRGTDFVYSTQGRIALARQARWQVELTDPPVGDPAPVITHVEPLSAMEYRHDGGRHRYMTRSRRAASVFAEHSGTTGQGYAGRMPLLWR